MNPIDVAKRIVAVGKALEQLDDLPPFDTAVIYPDGASLMPISDYSDPWGELRQVAAWAKRFDVELELSLSYGGRGRVHAIIRLPGVTGDVKVQGDINSAHAYELGRALQRPLSRDDSVIVSPEELLQVLDELAPAASS